MRINKYAIKADSSMSLTEMVAASPYIFQPPDEKKEPKRWQLYDEFMQRDANGCKEIRTGDLLAYSTYPGEGILDCMRCVAKAVSSTEYTHVGVLIVLEVKGKNRYYVMEAETNESVRTQEATSGRGDSRNGIWLFDLAERVLSDPARMWHLPLQTPLSAEAKASLEEYMTKVYVEDPLFDKDGMFAAGFDLFDKLGFEQRQDFCRLFCSEFTALCMQATGLLTPYVNASEKTPADVTSFPFLCLSSVFELKREGMYHDKRLKKKKRAN